MLYNGIDLVETDRIAQAVARWGGRFLRRVFTTAEITACRDRVPSLAARWAAKEAAAKMLGVGLRGLGGISHHTERDGVAWTEIEVSNDAHGRPLLALHGRAAERAALLGIHTVAISLSHTTTHAIASVVGLAHPPAPPAPRA